MAAILTLTILLVGAPATLAGEIPIGPRPCDPATQVCAGAELGGTENTPSYSASDVGEVIAAVINLAFDILT